MIEAALGEEMLWFSGLHVEGNSHVVTGPPFIPPVPYLSLSLCLSLSAYTFQITLLTCDPSSWLDSNRKQMSCLPGSALLSLFHPFSIKWPKDGCQSIKGQSERNIH